MMMYAMRTLLLIVLNGCKQPTTFCHLIIFGTKPSDLSPRTTAARVYSLGICCTAKNNGFEELERRRFNGSSNGRAIQVGVAQLNPMEMESPRKQFVLMALAELCRLTCQSVSKLRQHRTRHFCPQCRTPARPAVCVKPNLIRYSCPRFESMTDDHYDPLAA